MERPTKVGLQRPATWTDSHRCTWSRMHLFSYLAAEYQIVVSEDPDNAQVLDTEPPAFNRSVRLSPEGVSGESMSIIYTSFPGVAVYVGSSYDGIFPVCGCDACDDDINDVVTDLEEHVLSLSRNRLGWSRRT